MLSKLIKHLDERAINAGFQSPEDGKLLLAADPNWPEAPLNIQVKYWSTVFASVLLVYLDCDTSKVAWTETRRAEAFLDAALMRLEKNGSVVDGYLVLALSQVNGELKKFMGEVEKDTRFVRKHVVYLEADEWQRCQRITPLGLTVSTARSEYFEFEPENQQMDDLLASLAIAKGKDLGRCHAKEWSLNE
jgi:hypothetical protein